jgi:hypothetical protein
MVLGRRRGKKAHVFWPEKCKVTDDASSTKHTATVQQQGCQERIVQVRSWFPAQGERWVLEVGVETLREADGRCFVRYRPLYMQARGAVRELQDNVFLHAFYPERGPKSRPLPSSRWQLLAEVTAMDPGTMTVSYRHVKPSGEPISDAKRMSIHVFRACFRRETGAGELGVEKDPDWESERGRWRRSQRVPSRGDWFLLNVVIDSVRVDGEKRFVKYLPEDTQEDAAPRELEEKVFRGLFEPTDGAVGEISPGDQWFMMVEVTDYDPEEFSVWYRPISSAGEKNGQIRHLSDYVFLATFSPAK